MVFQASFSLLSFCHLAISNLLVPHPHAPPQHAYLHTLSQTVWLLHTYQNTLLVLGSVSTLMEMRARSIMVKYWTSSRGRRHDVLNTKLNLSGARRCRLEQRFGARRTRYKNFDAHQNQHLVGSITRLNARRVKTFARYE